MECRSASFITTNRLLRIHTTMAREYATGLLQVVGINLLASKAELFFTLWLSRKCLALTQLRVGDEFLLKPPRIKTYILMV